MRKFYFFITAIVLLNYTTVNGQELFEPTSGVYFGVSQGNSLDATQLNYLSFADFDSQFSKHHSFANGFVGFPSEWSGAFSYDSFPDWRFRANWSSNSA